MRPPDSLPGLCGALALALTAGADAAGATERLGWSVATYGQISPAWLAYDDGRETTEALADNGNATSRVGLRASPTSGSGLELTFETGLGFVQTGDIANGDVPGPFD